MSSNLPYWVFNYGNKEVEVKGTKEALQHTANDVGNISNDEILVKERVSELPPTSIGSIAPTTVQTPTIRIPTMTNVSTLVPGISNLQPPQGKHQGILRNERPIPQTKFGVD
ncbi:hypothetical protein CK203_036149 [Vitis vinifera]|uniref:Uncharacterized protein n=1 Tax=Vitis vinifera TaxID=29760 RepID=A0A438IWR4_VITVI|nr:hypothetical protein CK203_094050 [Vitis vinifera]RVX01182.1 hypothetical protein CK203_036149 [Vitis vinifera]